MMRKMILVLCGSMLSLQSLAAQTLAPRPEDIATIEGILTAISESVSGPKGQERQWDRFASLFKPEGKIVPHDVNDSGELTHGFYGSQEYAEWTGTWPVENGFFEESIHEEIQRFGSIAHVFSTYVWRHEKQGPIVGRGINSIQLAYDDNRWWVTSILWAEEHPSNPIPERYLHKKENNNE